MSDPTIIPTEMRTELQQMALDAQAACPAAFDAIESGDLARTAMHTHDAAMKALALNTQIKPLAFIALAQIEAGLGIKFGDPR